MIDAEGLVGIDSATARTMAGSMSPVHAEGSPALDRWSLGRTLEN
jgi:hypothetical protein